MPSRLKKRDTTPEAQREALALARQGAAGTLPGTGAALDRIETGTNDTLTATRAGTSANSVIGLLQQSDNNRLNALAALDTRGDI